MNALDRAAREVTPPILLRALRAVAQRLGRKRRVPQPAGEKSANWYDAHYADTPEYHIHYTQSSYYFLWAVLADRIIRSGVERILDLGCGPGQVASLLWDKGIKRYRGLDLSPKCIEMAKGRCPNFEFLVTDLGRPEAMEGFDYDCIVTLEFLEHVHFDLAVIERIRRGTKMFATVPNFPYVSHVRHFADVQEVETRYGRYFSEFSVDAYLENQEGKSFFLMEGIKA